MNNFKINFVYNQNTKETINDIFIKILKKELKNYISLIDDSNKKNSISNCNTLCLDIKDDNN